MKYIQPEIRKGAFNCPHCEAYSDQYWGELMQQITTHGHGWQSLTDWAVCQCAHCKEFILWYEDKMIFPEKITLPSPNEDIEEEIKKDYLEAASIVEKSPKASAALLRLAIQKLCKQLGKPGKDLNDDIASLVRDGLPVQIQKALDSVRVIGNESVHPGEINLEDNKEIAYKLFELVNIIAQTMITNKKEIDKLYGSLPERKLKAIEKRDSK